MRRLLLSSIFIATLRFNTPLLEAGYFLFAMDGRGTIRGEFGARVGDSIELGRLSALNIRQLNQMQHLQHTLFNLLSEYFPVPQSKCDIVENSHMGEKSIGLKNHPCLATIWG